MIDKKCIDIRQSFLAVDQSKRCMTFKFSFLFLVQNLVAILPVSPEDEADGRSSRSSHGVEARRGLLFPSTADTI